MAIRLYTSGVMGTLDLFDHLRCLYPTASYYNDLDDLELVAGLKHWPELYEDATSFIINLLPVFERDDLRTQTDDSPKLKSYLTLVTHLLPIWISMDKDVHIIAREHGLGFVPMVTTHREQIRRETRLTALVARVAASHQIMFAGRTFLTVNRRD